jgi:L-seryl-tRNA(Ser) seleniumtransferase
MAGKMSLMQAAYAQNRGIGRGMKIGKEGIIGLMAALEQWEKGYYREKQEEEKRRMLGMVERLAGLPGVRATAEWPSPDPFPIMRTKITVDPEVAGLTAMALTQLLAEGEPTVRVRAHHAEEGYFLIDPFNLSDADADYICQRIIEIIKQPSAVKEAMMASLPFFIPLPMPRFWA